MFSKGIFRSNVIFFFFFLVLNEKWCLLAMNRENSVYYFFLVLNEKWCLLAMNRENRFWNCQFVVCLPDLGKPGNIWLVSGRAGRRKPVPWKHAPALRITQGGALPLGVGKFRGNLGGVSKSCVCLREILVWSHVQMSTLLTGVERWIDKWWRSNHPSWAEWVNRTKKEGMVLLSLQQWKLHLLRGSRVTSAGRFGEQGTKEFSVSAKVTEMHGECYQNLF